MKKTTLFSSSVLHRSGQYCVYTVSMIALLFISQPLGAQDSTNCQMNCPGPFQVSVDQNCEAIIYPDSLLLNPGGSCPLGEFKGYATIGTDTFSGNPILIPAGAAFGKYTLVIKDTSVSNGNSCWTNFTLSDYLPPTISCRDTCMSCLTSANFLPVATDNCDPNPLVILIGSFPLDSCSDKVLGGVIQTYLTTDHNNGSDTCSQRIYFERLSLDSVEFPVDTTLSCDSVFLTTNEGGVEGAPHPSVVGEPMVDSLGIWSNHLGICNFIVAFEDVEVPLPGGCHNKIKRKILRTWTIIEWFCYGGDTTIMMGQKIELIDTTPPIIHCPNDILVGAGSHDCMARVVLPPARAIDSCCVDVDVAISTPNGFMFSNGGVVNLPAGVHTVTYFATDACGNLDSCSITVTVEDLSPPEPVCIKFISTGVTTSGFAKIFAEDFDKGSHDNCGPVYFKVLRMDDELVDEVSGGSSALDDSPFACGGVNGDDSDAADTLGNQLGHEVFFDDYAKFCCADIESGPVMVILRVYDYLPDHLIEGPIPRSYHENILKGHFNDCMIEVTVQDKLPPRVTCVGPITVSCEFDWDPNDLKETFGDVVADESLRDSIIIVDYALYGDLNPHFVGYDGFGSDNCNVMVSERDPVIDLTCNVGTIYRTWDITDDGGRTVSCSQVITIINPNAFVPLPNAFPSDTIITAICDVNDLTPSVTGMFDQSNESECSKVIATYEDLLFESVPGVCFKILRHWTVVDWCQFNSNSDGVGLWEGDQLIAVMNTVGPTITSSCDDREPIISQDANCGPEEVELTVTATDDCTPTADLRFSYAIDLHDNNTIDDAGNGTDASGQFELGSHRITWTVEDLCGNKTSCSFLFSILSGTKPVPACIGMATVVDDNGIATIWVGDIDNKSAHPCGNAIEISFSPDSIVLYKEFTCDDLGDNDVNLYAIDELGNVDFCTATVTIQDNTRDVCPGNNLAITVGGSISTYDSEAVGGTSVYLDGSEANPSITNQLGDFAFYNMPMGGNYQVRPYNNDNTHQSINTVDLIYIQRHILNLETLQSPYQWIAADANDDGNIDVLDLLMIQKVILGLSDNFGDNTSWRFIDASYDFGGENPLTQDYDEQFDIVNLSDHMVADFVGVKVGDVNGSYRTEGLTSGGVSSRSINSMNLESVKSDNSIQLFADQAYRFMGLQLQLSVPRADEIVSISSDVLPINKSNYSITESGVKISWYASHVTDIPVDQSLITIHYSSKVRKSDEIKVVEKNNSEFLSEAYVTPTDVRSIDITSRSDGTLYEGYVLYQNSPNPFTEITRIGFDLASPDEVALTIYDISGRLVHRQQQELPAGYNEMTIQQSDLDHAGIYYYQLSTDEFMATKKMILIE